MSSKNFELLSMQFFSLNFHYSVSVSFVLISCLFAEQHLFENFVSTLEQLSNANATVISRARVMTETPYLQLNC